MKEQVDKYLLDLVGYCLMSNHIHIVAIPHEQDSLAKAVGRPQKKLKNTYKPKKTNAKQADVR